MTDTTKPKYDIPQKEYEEMIRKMPFPSVDAVINYDGGILLGRRTRSPAKGLYWTTGGRLLFGETPEEAAVRIAKDETGLDTRVRRFINAYSEFFEHGYFGPPSHAIALSYLMETYGGTLTKDFQHSDFVVVRNLDTKIKLSEYCRQVIIDSGILGDHPDKGKRTNFRFK